VADNDKGEPISPLDKRSVSPLATNDGVFDGFRLPETKLPEDALSILAASAASGYDAAQRAAGHQREASLRQTLERAADEAEAKLKVSEASQNDWQKYADHAVFGQCELLGLLFGLPFGDDLYHGTPITGWHLFYLAIGLLFAGAGPMFPWIRTRSWIPERISASLSRAALDARIRIIALLLLFVYGVAPAIYRRATMPVAVTGTPLPAKNETMLPPNLGRTSWFNLFNGLTQPAETLLLPKWFVITTSPPENAEAATELNTIFYLASTVSGALSPAGLPDYSKDLDAPKLEGKALRGITIHGRNQGADFIAETLQNCFVVLRTAEMPTGLFDYYHRQNPTVFPQDQFVWLEIGNGSPWKGNCRG
jgi:hypothetical protein